MKLGLEAKTVYLKADCFSFAMFLYELLTLKMPFEGQEQIKEYILDGGRPVLMTKVIDWPYLRISYTVTRFGLI